MPRSTRPKIGDDDLRIIARSSSADNARRRTITPIKILRYHISPVASCRFRFIVFPWPRLYILQRSKYRQAVARYRRLNRPANNNSTRDGNRFRTLSAPTFLSSFLLQCLGSRGSMCSLPLLSFLIAPRAFTYTERTILIKFS